MVPSLIGVSRSSEIHSFEAVRLSYRPVLRRAYRSLTATTELEAAKLRV